MIAMKKFCLLLALLLALCACAYAETEAAARTAEDFIGLWNMEYVTADGFMVTAEAYGIEVTLTLNADGTAVMLYPGEAGVPMSWYTEDGHAYISGYNADADVEMLLSEDGVLEIADAVGSMFLTRPAEEAA